MNDMLGKRKYQDAQCELRYSNAIPYDMRQTFREIFNLKTTAGMRGKGQGTKLMEQITAEADKARKALILMADNEKLELWYNRFGFEVLTKEPKIIMMRKPK